MDNAGLFILMNSNVFKNEWFSALRRHTLKRIGKHDQPSRAERSADEGDYLAEGQAEEKQLVL